MLQPVLDASARCALIPEEAALPAETPRINDFAFKIGTVNGTGSASANSLLMQALFRMGIPVSGKNVFPSNIQGLPTWYEIRVNADGFTARMPYFDLLVALNPATHARDVAEVQPGGFLLYDSSWPLEASLRRDDVHLLGVPMGEMCVEHFERPRDRVLMKNIVYVGALAALLGIDTEVIRKIQEERFGNKPRLLEANFLAIRLGYDFACRSFRCPLHIRVERMDANRGKILLDGNTAAALGCLYAGATVGAWYPINPRHLADGRVHPASAVATAWTRRPDGTASSSCRRRTSWRPPGWRSAPGGWARGRSPTPPGRGSR